MQIPNRVNQITQTILDKKEVDEMLSGVPVGSTTTGAAYLAAQLPDARLFEQRLIEAITEEVNDFFPGAFYSIPTKNEKKGFYILKVSKVALIKFIYKEMLQQI